MPYSYSFNDDNYDDYDNPSFYNDTVIYNRDIISYMMGCLLLIGDKENTSPPGGFW